MISNTKLNDAGDGVVITEYIGTSAYVVIPVEIEGFPVMEIEGARALMNGISYVGITLPIVRR